MKCKDCKWFNGRLVGSNEIGNCRRYAPRPGGFATDITNWPRVHTYDGCGEFEAKAVEEVK